MRTQSAVHGNLQGQGHQQGERTREQTEQEESGDMSPVRTRLLKQPPVKDVVAKLGHRASSNPSLFSARQTAAVALPAAWRVSPPTANARAPRTQEAAHAWSELAAQAKTARDEASTKPTNENRGWPCKRTSCLPEPYSSLTRRRRTFPKTPLPTSKS